MVFLHIIILRGTYFMKWFKRVLQFIFVVFMYFLPSFIFKTDLAFYDQLEGPKLPSIVFPIVWSIIYVLMGIFIVMLFENKKKYNKKDFTRVIIFLTINYLISFTFPYFFFVKESLFLGYLITLLSFLTITLTTIESLLLSKKYALLLLPYVIWGIIASVFAILLYLNN